MQDEIRAGVLCIGREQQSSFHLTERRKPAAQAQEGFADWEGAGYRQ
jgi:hypothetical protein